MVEHYEFEIASTQKRTVAFFIDDLVVALLVFAIFYEKLMGLSAIVSLEERINAVQLFLNQNPHFCGYQNSLSHLFCVAKR